MQQPTIGILAGMGPRSTAPFVDLVITECQNQYGAKNDIDFPTMMICSLPAPFYSDRPTDHRAMESTIRIGLQDLARTGVDFIAIPCNTAHIYYQQLAASISVPLLNMVELAIASIPSHTSSVAVIAARPTIDSGIYQDGIQRRGSRFIEIDWQQDVDKLIGSTRISRDPALFRSLWKVLTQQAKSANADTILIACMDLSAIKIHIETDLRILDAGECLSSEIVSQWLALRRQCQNNTVTEGRCRGNYRVSSDRRQLDIAAIHNYLTHSYWAEGISLEAVTQSIQWSLCFGLFDKDRQVGFARIITDHTTFAYLCDVYVLEEHRGQGLGKWLVQIVTEDPALAKVRRFALATKDAHGLYSQFGFAPLQEPSRFMEIFRPKVYISGQ